MRQELIELEKNYEMPDEIDMSGATRGRFYTPHKVQVNIRLDDDIILYFKKLAIDKKQGYQTLLNSALREYMKEHSIQVSL